MSQDQMSSSERGYSASRSSAVATCDRLLRRSLRASSLTIFLSFGLVGGWLYIARLDSAVVSEGVLENANTTRQIQHLEGGIVLDFFVRNGDRVRAGDLLLRLDSTGSAASVELFQTQILGNRARQERLEAEIAMLETLELTPELNARLSLDPALVRIAEAEKRQFSLHRKEVDQARQLLETNIAQARSEINANEVRRNVAQREIALIKADLADQKSLLERGLTSQGRVTELEQQSLALEERIAQSVIEIARINQAILGIQLQIAQLDQEYRSRAAAELDTVTREIRALERDSIVASDSLKRVEIRAPVDGTIQESILGTVGAVIRGGETILKIAPSEDDYIIIARVAPNDIDGILPGSEALISFPAFQSLDLPPAEGVLVGLSRDRVIDPATHVGYYEARIRLDQGTLPGPQRERLVAGMTANTILPTGQRTALNYLLGPLARRLQSAMREE